MAPGDQRRARTGRRSPRLSVLVTDEWGRTVRSGDLAAWLSAVAPARVRGEVGVALVSDARVRTLNRAYRRRDFATDVLSFPAFAPLDPEGASAGHSSSYLGDIVIARGVARRQARRAGHREAIELRVLALHGLLHLLGYDHEHASDDGRMARAERRLRRKGRLPAGLMERGGR